MKQPCKYNIIRFEPYPERQEFANIGIVLYAPWSRDFSYRLLGENRRDRVMNFFEGVDEAFFCSTMNLLERQLERVKALIVASPSSGESIYNELVRLRQDIVYYGERGACLTENPQSTCDEMFARRVMLS